MTKSKTMTTTKVRESLYDRFKTDQTLEVSGKWLDYGKYGKLRVARAGGANTRFSQTLEFKTREYREEIDDGTIDMDLANTLMIETFAESVILDWEDVIGEDGKEIPFSSENVTKLFTDMPDFWANVREKASSMNTYKNKKVAKDVGN